MKKPKNKKIMFLCAHNQSRSVTAEGLLTGEKGYEVKSRALWKDYPRRITKHEGQWADEVFVMMPGMIPVAEEAGINKKKIKALWIPDNYYVCQPSLLRELKKQLEGHGIYITKSLEKAKSDCYKVNERKMGFAGGLKGTWVDNLYEFGAQPIIKPWSGEDDFEKAISEQERQREEEMEEEEISGHVTRRPRTAGYISGQEPWRDRFSYHEYVPAFEKAQDTYYKVGQIPPERYVPVTGDESEEEIVERARRLWKFYDATDVKQKKLR